MIFGIETYADRRYLSQQRRTGDRRKRYLRRVMKTIMIAASLAIAAVSATHAADPNADAAIKAVVSQLDTCLAAPDAKCVEALFATDATVAGPTDGGKIVSGRAEILKVAQNNPGAQAMKQARSVDRIRFIGKDRALVDCTVRVTGSSPDASTPQTWHTTALVTLTNGKWLFQDVRSYVVDPRPIAGLTAPTPVTPPAPPPAAGTVTPDGASAPIAPTEPPSGTPAAPHSHP